MKTLLLLAPAVLALTACHSNGGYMSADPALTYGPGVVEFPDPARVYLPEYRRHAVAMSSVAPTMAAYAAAPVAAPTIRTAPIRISTSRPDPSAMSVRVQPPAAPTMRMPVASVNMRAANVSNIRGDMVRGDALVLDRPVAPNLDEVRIRGERMPAHMISAAGVSTMAPPKGAPLPPPTADRPFRETELVVTPGGVYTR